MPRRLTPTADSITVGVIAAFAAAATAIAVVAAPDTATTSAPDLTAQSLPDAQTALSAWAEANVDTGSIGTYSAGDGRWAAFVTSATGSADRQFPCVAITSASPQAFVYDDEPSGNCDIAAPTLQLPMSDAVRSSLRDDWDALQAAVTSRGPVGAYQSVMAFRSPLAYYEVVDSAMVSPYETVLNVQQQSRDAAFLGQASRSTDRAYLVVPMTGPVTLVHGL